MLSTKRFKKKRFWGLLIITIGVVIIVWSFVLINNHKDESGIILNSDIEGWHTYLNESYGFKISYPDSWMIYESFSNGAPVINIYEPRFSLIPPFDQFSNVNNVSIYPKGIESELIIGETAESDIDMNVEIDDATDYLLSSGDIWATHITFEDSNDSWTPWGFIWSRLLIDNEKYSCLRDEKDIPVEDCNPLGGDSFIRTGEVVNEIKEIQIKILESFEFIEN